MSYMSHLAIDLQIIAETNSDLQVRSTAQMYLDGELDLSNVEQFVKCHQ
jgi:hypothetical protein